MIALVGLWSSHALVVFDAATLTTLHSVDVSSSTLLRSVLPISYEDGSTVVYIGLGDGVLISIPLEFSGENSVLLREEAKKSITLGSRPITLASFISKLEGDADTSQDQQNLFVSSDQPTVISRNKGRLNYASMNMRNISAATSFNSVAYSDALVFATPDGLRIGRIDKVQSLHVRTILLGGDQPRRIAHSPLLHAYGILCVKEVVDQSSGSIIKTGSFKIVDDADFDSANILFNSKPSHKTVETNSTILTQFFWITHSTMMNRACLCKRSRWTRSGALLSAQPSSCQLNIKPNVACFAHLPHLRGREYFRSKRA